MNIDIDNLTEDELYELNHRIIERLKFLDTIQAHQNMMAFNIGCRVSFDSKDGRQLGTLTKFNQKTVTVISDNGRRWRISPHFLSKVNDVKPEQKFIDYDEKPKR